MTVLVTGGAGYIGSQMVYTLVDAGERSGMYTVEYTVALEGAPTRHLLSLAALGYNGRYNRLYTATGQCPEDELEQWRPTLAAALDSFAPPPTRG